MVNISRFIFVVFPLLISVAFLTLLERKLLRLVGLRLGPNKVSTGGFFQPITDAIKLSNKRVNLLSNFSVVFYISSSSFILILRLVLISCLCIFPSPVSFKYSILFFFLVLGFNSFNSMLGGWRTFGKYPLIGRLRTVSQLISYEAVLYVCLFSLVIVSSSFDFCSFRFLSIFGFGVLVIPCLFVWVPTFLAELNRTPFDFSEGERELVRGFNTEYGSTCFTLIFLSEYSNIIFFCILSSFLFFKGLGSFFLFLVFFVIWLRSVIPRFRFDKLMGLAWKFYIPFLTFYFLFLFLFIS